MAEYRRLIAGNWKMNGLLADGTELAAGLVERAAAVKPACDVAVCPPFTLLHPVAGILRGSPIRLGAQDCHTAASGAHTGDVAASMLSDIGCSYAIVGHSERRADHNESDALVAAKAAAALAAGLVPIICVGETLEEREAGKTLEIVLGQITGSLPDAAGGSIVIAYEPVWAIGTGRVPTLDDVAAVHAAIRQALTGQRGDGASIPILYGGSAKPENARDLLSVQDVGGLLVGGASLQVDSFWQIVSACD